MNYEVLSCVEELFIDYGQKYDRKDYLESADVQEQENLTQQEELRKIKSNRFQKVIYDDSDDLSIDQDTSLKGGFFDKLAKKANTKSDGILNPKEAVNKFNELGVGMFTSDEDQDLIESIAGNSTAAKMFVKSRGVSEDMEAEKSAKLRNYFDDIDKVNRKETADVADDIEDKLSESAMLFGDLGVVPKRASQNNDKSKKETKEIQPKKSTPSEEEIKSLWQRVDSMSDDELKGVIEKLQSLTSTLTNKVDKSISEVKLFQNKTINENKARPALRYKESSTGNEEVTQLEEELQKLFNNPSGVWEDLLKNPEKYLDEEDIKVIDSMDL